MDTAGEQAEPAHLCPEIRVTRTDARIVSLTRMAAVREDLKSSRGKYVRLGRKKAFRAAHVMSGRALWRTPRALGCGSLDPA